MSRLIGSPLDILWMRPLRNSPHEEHRKFREFFRQAIPEIQNTEHNLFEIS